MGFLQRLKEADSSNLAVDTRCKVLSTESTGSQGFQSASTLLRQIQATADLIPNTPDSERGTAVSKMEALRRHFDSLSLEARLAAALTESQPTVRNRPSRGNKKPAHCFPFVFSDPIRPGKYTACRYGNRSVVGHGNDEIEALDDLERLEAGGDREHSYVKYHADTQLDFWSER
jgi:hypothetical protein